jgi:hypothetical protein
MILSHTPMLTLEELGDKFSDFGTVSQRGIPEIIQNWSNQRIKALQNNLLKNNSTASKRLYEDISGDVTTTPSGYNLSIKMQDYYFWVENGRKPTQGGGDGELYKSIYEWITFKRDLQANVISKSKNRIAATKSLAYVITRKIHEKGTKARPFIAPAQKDVPTDVLAKRISEFIIDSLTT